MAADLVATRVAAGLALSVALAGVFALLSRAAGARQALAFPGIGMVAASLLSWQALVRWTWAPLAVAALLAAGAALVLRRTGGRAPGSGEWPAPLEALPARALGPALLPALALAALALDWLYAALPDYRYDQWNYHLVVPRAVRGGPLTLPALNEHAAFTGVWEYLFTIPRALSNDDLVNQSAVNAFSWLFLAIGLLLFVRRFGPEAFPRGPAALVVLAWTLSGLPDQPGLMNAKPDPVLLLAALGVLDLVARKERTAVDAAFLGFYAVAPLALKVTWLHFAAAALPVAVWGWRPPWPRAQAAAAAAGLAGGALVAAPFLLKNALLFGNPLHPVQLGPLRSATWSAAEEGYWRAMMRPAHGLGSFAETLAALPLAITWQLWVLALPVLILAVAALVGRLRGASVPAPPVPAAKAPVPAPPSGRLLRAALAIAALHLLMWPLFFHAAIGARFVLTGLAMLVVALWVALGRVYPAALGPRPSPRAAWITLVLLLPAAGFGHMAWKAERVVTFGSWSVERFLRDGPPEWRVFGGLRDIARDRRAARKDAAWNEAVTLADVPAVYGLDGAALVAGGLEYQWLRARAACPWDLLLRLDVRYVFARTGRLDTWIAELRELAPGLRPLTPGAQAFALDRTFLERLRESDPSCALASEAAGARSQ